MLAELDGAAPAAYDIDGQRLDVQAPGFAQAIARAHAMQLRPRCMCQPAGIETYVAKINGGYVVKRMPETGSRHAASCPHFEPPTDANGFGTLIGTAIREDPATGLTALRVDFSMSRQPPRQTASPKATHTLPTARSGAKLSLHELLLYLWHEAGLTRWQPGFAGKRNWATVRWRLLQAASDKLIGGRPLRDRLYIPEAFAVERRDEIAHRRAAAWSLAKSSGPASGQFLLLIGELKEIAPARCEFRAVVKHMPDQAFMVDERLHRQMTLRLQPALALWNAADDVRMLVIGTFAINAAGVPAMAELALMTTTREWIPVSDIEERESITRLVREDRSFIKRFSRGLLIPEQRSQTDS
ncbi:DUF1173 family protein [Roseateles sp. BYS96W]|uniref:DUF1173 family protein n=1 Tax=Pelomonas nitida TaxID=3299027 RepID=A0ABW7G9X8_9BURK